MMSGKDFLKSYVLSWRSVSFGVLHGDNIELEKNIFIVVRNILWPNSCSWMVDRSDEASSRREVGSLSGSSSCRWRHGGDRGAAGCGKGLQGEGGRGARRDRSTGLSWSGGRRVGEFHRHRLGTTVRNRAVEMLNGSLCFLALVIANKSDTFWHTCTRQPITAAPEVTRPQVTIFAISPPSVAVLSVTQWRQTKAKSNSEGTTKNWTQEYKTNREVIVCVYV